ncbi:MAG: hypothetical protein J0L88_03940 [Xanthomonadales bacterium]|nr:hypothetical protein [Xanthomonadales bacterium]
MRRALFIVAVLASAFLALAWASGLHWGAPLSAQQRNAFDGSHFNPVMGAAAADGARLRIAGLGEGETALQSVALNGVDAAEYSLLRYRFDGFPHTLELSLVFRRADSRDDVRVVSLPWPGGDSWFDLSSVPEWQGRIIEVGFAEYPTPQVVPPGTAFEPFVLVDAALESRSWRGDLAALATDWLGYWPWSQRSVHALGRDTDTPRAGSLVVCVAIVAIATMACGFVILGWRGRRVLVAASTVVAAGWLLLDLQWHSGLRWRQEGSRALYAGLEWPQREQRSADTGVIEAAREIAPLLAREPDATRILVHAGSSFEQLRLVYHLLPRNVAVLAQVLARAGATPLPARSILVVYNAEGWAWDADRRELRSDDLSWPAELLFERGPLIVVRIRGVGP